MLHNVILRVPVFHCVLCVFVDCFLSGFFFLFWTSFFIKVAVVIFFINSCRCFVNYRCLYLLIEGVW